MPPRHHLQKRLHRRLRNQPRRNEEFVQDMTEVTRQDALMRHAIDVNKT
jgi:hypothetical protein